MGTITQHESIYVPDQLWGKFMLNFYIFLGPIMITFDKSLKGEKHRL